MDGITRCKNWTRIIITCTHPCTHTRAPPTPTHTHMHSHAPAHTHTHTHTNTLVDLLILNPDCYSIGNSRHIPNGHFPADTSPTDTSPTDTSPTDTSPTDTSPNGHIPDRSFPRTDTSPNGKFPERKIPRPDTSPTYTSPTLHFSKNILELTIPINGHFIFFRLASLRFLCVHSKLVVPP